MRRLRSDDRGGVTVLFLMLIPFAVAFIGLAWDAGRAVNYRATTEDVAESAARAGATAVVQRTGEPPVLDPALAHERAALLLAQYPDYSGSVAVTLESVTVTVTSIYEPEFLGRFGVGAWTFEGAHLSELQIGVFVDGDTGG